MKTEIVYILDRSGSMSSNWTESIGSLKAFIEEQQKDETPCKFTLVGFDTYYDIFIDAKDLKDIDANDLPVFRPRGGTALYDAIGKSVMLIKERISNTPEFERPDKVLFVILTDGYENASNEYRKADITSIITKQETDSSWEFIYVGVGLDVMQEAVSLGIKGSNTRSSISKSSTDIRNLTSYASNTISSYRSGN